MGFLYKITSPSGKSYIGISLKSVDNRWKKHVEHAFGKRPGALYAALRKYGPEAFTRCVIAEEPDWDRLCQMEVDAIRDHRTKTPRGYNMTDGGEGTVGHMTEEARINISRAQKKRFERPDQLAMLLEASRRASEASHQRGLARRAIKRAERQAYVKSDEFKRSHSAQVRAALARPEVREKVLACARARSASQAWKDKISSSKTGRKVKPCSDQRKQRIAEARRREWADPVMRAKRLAAFASAREKVVSQ